MKDPKHQNQGTERRLRFFFLMRKLIFVVLKKNNKNYKNLYQKIGVIKWIMKKQKKKNYIGNKNEENFILLFISLVLYFI